MIEYMLHDEPKGIGSFASTLERPLGPAASNSFSHQSEEFTVNKPGIVFAHGLWADGSCFQKLIPHCRRMARSDVLTTRPGLAEKRCGVASPAASGGSVVR